MRKKEIDAIIISAANTQQFGMLDSQLSGEQHHDFRARILRLAYKSYTKDHVVYLDRNLDCTFLIRMLGLIEHCSIPIGDIYSDVVSKKRAASKIQALFAKPSFIEYVSRSFATFIENYDDHMMLEALEFKIISDNAHSHNNSALMTALVKGCGDAVVNKLLSLDQVRVNIIDDLVDDLLRCPEDKARLLPRFIANDDLCSLIKAEPSALINYSVEVSDQALFAQLRLIVNNDAVYVPLAANALMLYEDSVMLQYLMTLNLDPYLLMIGFSIFESNYELTEIQNRLMFDLLDGVISKNSITASELIVRMRKHLESEELSFDLDNADAVYHSLSCYLLQQNAKPAIYELLDYNEVTRLALLYSDERVLGIIKDKVQSSRQLIITPDAAARLALWHFPLDDGEFFKSLIDFDAIKEAVFSLSKLYVGSHGVDYIKIFMMCVTSKNNFKDLSRVIALFCSECDTIDVVSYFNRYLTVIGADIRFFDVLSQSLVDLLFSIRDSNGRVMLTNIAMLLPHAHRADFATAIATDTRAYNSPDLRNRIMDNIATRGFKDSKVANTLSVLAGNVLESITREIDSDSSLPRYFYQYLLDSKFFLFLKVSENVQFHLKVHSFLFSDAQKIPRSFIYVTRLSEYEIARLYVQVPVAFRSIFLSNLSVLIDYSGRLTKINGTGKKSVASLILGLKKSIHQALAPKFSELIFTHDSLPLLGLPLYQAYLQCTTAGKGTDNAKYRKRNRLVKVNLNPVFRRNKQTAVCFLVINARKLLPVLPLEIWIIILSMTHDCPVGFADALAQVDDSGKKLTVFIDKMIGLENKPPVIRTKSGFSLGEQGKRRRSSTTGLVTDAGSKNKKAHIASASDGKESPEGSQSQTYSA